MNTFWWNGGFYVRETEVGKGLPGAVEISQEQYTKLLTAQSEGKRIVSDSKGQPVPLRAYEYLENDIVLFDTTKEFQDAQHKAVNSIKTFANGIRQSISDHPDHYEIISWANKTERAERLLSGKGSLTDQQIVQIEAQKRDRNESVAMLASKQRDKAERHAMQLAVIDGLIADAKIQIRTASNIADLEPILKQFKASLNEELKALTTQQQSQQTSESNLVTKTIQKLRNIFHL